MKVVLLKDVRDMGRSGSVIEVADGHAINFLLPRKLAIHATPQAVAFAELNQKQAEEKKVIDMELLAQNMATLAEARVVLTMKANDKGHLYESVSLEEIAAAAKIAAGVDLPEDAIKLEKPIKEVGTFEIPLSVGKLFGKFTLIVEAAA